MIDDFRERGDGVKEHFELITFSQGEKGSFLSGT